MVVADVALRSQFIIKSKPEQKILIQKCWLCPSRVPGQPPLDDLYRNASFSIFLKTLQSPKPPNTDELFYCMVWTASES